MSNPIYRKEEMIRPEGATSFIILSFSADDIYYKIKENLKKSFSEILFESISLTSWTPTPRTRTSSFAGRLAPSASVTGSRTSSGTRSPPRPPRARRPP